MLREGQCRDGRVQRRRWRCSDLAFPIALILVCNVGSAQWAALMIWGDLIGVWRDLHGRTTISARSDVQDVMSLMQGMLFHEKIRRMR